MLRAILSVIAGYFAMFMIVFLSFSAAYLALGVDGTFQPGTYEVRAVWLVISFVLGLLAAMAGGWLCAAINLGPSRRRSSSSRRSSILAR